MPRPHKKRRICTTPEYSLFKPAGVNLKKDDIIELRLDELEAMRLANLEGLYQEQGAERMNTSRATFGRILDEARRKVTRALIHGKALKITGGNVSLCAQGEAPCKSCATEGKGVEKASASAGNAGGCDCGCGCDDDTCSASGQDTDGTRDDAH